MRKPRCRIRRGCGRLRGEASAAPVAPSRARGLAAQLFRVLGVDVRFVKLDATNIRVNPVFGAGDNNATHWSVKLNYTLTY